MPVDEKIGAMLAKYSLYRRIKTVQLWLYIEANPKRAAIVMHFPTSKNSSPFPPPVRPILAIN
jgi:hypothetical protein